MLSDDNITTEPVASPEPALEIPEITTPDISSQSTGSTGADLSSEAPEASRNVVDTVPVKDDNPVSSQPESQTPEVVIEPKTPEPAGAVAPASVPSAPAPTPSFLHDLLLRARAKIQFRKGKKLEKIMEVLSKRSKISNDDVQKLLHVSDATATRYLNILEQQGKIKQTGRTGKSVFYSKI